MVHSKDTFLWKEGSLATPGLEDVAEIGNGTKMAAEIDAIIQKNKALYQFTATAPPVTGSTDLTVNLSTAFPCVSFASMIAPSPDWFMGISNVNFIENNMWVDSLVLQVRVYDAGTEEGDVFGYNNPSTVPQQLVMILTPAKGSVLANGNSSIPAIATVRFKKI